MKLNPESYEWFCDRHLKKHDVELMAWCNECMEDWVTFFYEWID